jgi:hypothetical protein
MSSWIYIFSKFTPEALLIEIFVLCVLSATYAAYWFIRRRRTMEDGMIPAGVVKNYISTLIADAEQLRAHLYSLLSGSGIDPASLTQMMQGLTAGNTDQVMKQLAQGAVNPAAGAALAQVEPQLNHNSQALEALLIEKQKLERELALLKESKNAAGAANPGDAALVGQLQDRIKVLEAKLAEYSVIEDDLANLKRLQQENAQLKAQLAGLASGTIVAAVAAPTPAAESPAADSAFEGLVDQVEASLATTTPAKDPNEIAVPDNIVEIALTPTPAETPTVAEIAAAPIEAAPTGPISTSVGQNDADLVAEFEKMLSG